MRNLNNWLLNDRKLFVACFFVFLAISVARNRQHLNDTIYGDVEGYYLYLPALFIQHSFHHIPERDMNFRRNEQGEVVVKYTSGVSYFYLPFFLAAHGVTIVFGGDASGFSTPYYYGMILCGVFWAFFGLYFLKKLLGQFFSPTIVWTTLLSIMLGTNFFFYSTRAIGMSHVYSFALIAWILYLTNQYYQRPKMRLAALLGLLLGWLVLIRPTNCVLVIFIALFHVRTSSDISDRFLFFKKKFTHLLVAVFLAVIPMIPQFFYWKGMTGKWVKYSYEGEYFTYWNRPKIAAVLFDTQNGLFIYAPVLLFFLLGLWIGFKDRRTNFWGVGIVFVIITYIFASWWAWWFGGAYGHRCYIDFFPLLAFPMAVAFEQILLNKNKVIKYGAIATIAAMIYYSVGMTFLFRGSEVWDGPAWRWNWHGWLHLVRQLFP
jgi:MFS family permease